MEFFGPIGNREDSYHICDPWGYNNKNRFLKITVPRIPHLTENDHSVHNPNQGMTVLTRTWRWILPNLLFSFETSQFSFLTKCPTPELWTEATTRCSNSKFKSIVRANSTSACTSTVFLCVLNFLVGTLLAVQLSPNPRMRKTQIFDILELCVLARTVKALQSNQLNFNISVSGLIDYFQRIYSTTTKVKKYVTEMNDNLKIVTNYKIKFSLISFWNNIIIFFKVLLKYYW